MYSYLRSPFRDLYVYDKMVLVRVLLLPHLGVLRTPFFGFHTHPIFLNSMTNRKIPRAIASNEGAMWGQGYSRLLRGVMAHAREGRMAIKGMVGDKGLVGHPTKGDESAADLGLMTERGSSGCDTQALMNTRPIKPGQTVRLSPAPRDCHHRRHIPRSSRGKEKGWTWGKS